MRIRGYPWQHAVVSKNISEIKANKKKRPQQEKKTRSKWLIKKKTEIGKKRKGIRIDCDGSSNWIMFYFGQILEYVVKFIIIKK